MLNELILTYAVLIFLVFMTAYMIERWMRVVEKKIEWKQNEARWRHAENMEAITKHQEAGVRAWAHKEGLAAKPWESLQPAPIEDEPEEGEDFLGVTYTYQDTWSND